MRRFILIDACLCDLGSHPYHYCLDVLAAAERSGFRCTAVTHRSFEPSADEWPDAYGLEPILEVAGHSKYTAFGELDRLSPRGRRRMRTALSWATAHADRRREQRIESFARGIAPVIREVSAGDVVFVATASELDVAGLARAIREGRCPPGVSWHAQFHYPLYRGFLEDFPRQEKRLDRIRRIMTKADEDAAPHRIHRHVTTEELATQHRRLGGTDVTVLPYPVRTVSGGDDVAANDGERHVLRIAALGDARPEKHSHLLAEVAARAGDDPELSGRLAFVVQSNPGFPADSRSREHRAVLRSIERLATLPRGTAELLAGPLTAAAYAAELQAADAMLLAYDQDRYRCRCSGITLEAIASGVVPIVTGGGWMARMLDEPLQHHIDTVLARSKPGPRVGTGPIRIREGRPARFTIELPAHATAIVVRLAWNARGDDAFNVPAARVTLAIEGRPQREVVVHADPLGRDGRAILPVPNRTGFPRQTASLSLDPVPGGHAIRFDRAEFQAIDSGAIPPASAAGLVVAPGARLVDSILEAFRELVRHPDHYRRTAKSRAAAMAERFCGDRVVEAMLAVADEPTHRNRGQRCT